MVEAPLIEIHGEGCATGKLIEVTEQLVKEIHPFEQTKSDLS